MEYRLEKRGFWSATWVVFDSTDREMFFMKSETLCGVDYLLTDAGGTALGRLRDIGGWWQFVYEVTIGGTVEAVMNSDGAWFSWGFVVDLAGGRQIAMKKETWVLRFTFTSGGAVVGRAESEGWLGRSYRVTLNDDEHQLALLACVVAADDRIARSRK